MTTLEASLKLIDWFSENDYFNFPKDLNKLLVIHENENDKFPVLAALKNLTEESILASMDNSSEEKIYFLNLIGKNHGCFDCSHLRPNCLHNNWIQFF